MFNIEDYVDSELEKKILSYIIANDKIINEVKQYLFPEVFSLQISQILTKWILEYFERYKKAPGIYIFDILESKKPLLPENKHKEIYEYLDCIKSFLSEKNKNEEYLLDKVREFIRKRFLETNVDKLYDLLKKNKVSEAEEICKDLNRNNVGGLKYDWHFPIDDDNFISEAFAKQEESLIEFHNDFDNFLGPIRRGYLIGIQGAYKRGKTWLLQEFIWQAIANQRKVAFVSLEMQDTLWAPRFYMQLTNSSEEEGELTIPRFDCLKNVKGVCHIPQLSDKWKSNNNLNVCKRCLEYDKANYRFSLSYEKINNKIHIGNVRNTLQDIRDMYGSKLFASISFPEYSASVTDIMSALDYLEDRNNFIPDIVIIDYADALKPISSRFNSLEAEDENWKMMKNLSSTRRIVVITPTQVTRKGTEKETISGTDVGGFVRKRGSVDMMLAINQTEEEKDKGIMRLGIVDHRWRKFSKNEQLITLQQLGLGQPCLDCMIVKYNGGEYEII